MFFCVAEDVESMTGEIDNGILAVRDVADLLQPQYAIITGELRAIVELKGRQLEHFRTCLHSCGEMVVLSVSSLVTLNFSEKECSFHTSTLPIIFISREKY